MQLRSILIFLLISLALLSCSKDDNKDDGDSNNSNGNNSASSNPLIGKWGCYCDFPSYSAFYTFYDNGTVLIEDTAADLNFTVTYSYNSSNNQLVLAGAVNTITWVSSTEFIRGGDSHYKMN
jgi:hypothetical protein